MIAVISQDGTLTAIAEPASSDLIARTVGSYGITMVRLDPAYQADGWTTTSPEPANTVGSCVLATLGADWRPYPGTIVITGHRDGQFDELDRPVRAAIEAIHTEVRAVLDGPSPRHVPAWANKAWRGQIRQLAEQIRTGAESRSSS